MGTKDVKEGSGLFATVAKRCIFVSVSNYDTNNPNHFDFIRDYVKNFHDIHPTISVSIHFLNSYEKLENCSCQTSGSGVNAKNELAFATFNWQYVTIMVNSFYGYGGGDMPIKIKTTYRPDLDSYKRY